MAPAQLATYDTSSGESNAPFRPHRHLHAHGAHIHKIKLIINLEILIKWQRFKRKPSVCKHCYVGFPLKTHTALETALPSVQYQAAPREQPLPPRMRPAALHLPFFTCPTSDLWPLFPENLTKHGLGFNPTEIVLAIEVNSSLPECCHLWHPNKLPPHFTPASESSTPAILQFWFFKS